MLTDSEQLGVLERDYERKNEQLHRHLTSVWIRFNFFIGFEGIIIGSKAFMPMITASGNAPSYDYSICILGLLISLIWYCFAANDRYLVKIYRNHVEQAFNTLKRFCEKHHFNYLGETEYVIKTSSIHKADMNFLCWRMKKLGLTDFATLVPVVLFIFWVVYISICLFKRFGEFPSNCCA